MPSTYWVAVAWDVGCDDCGEYDTFESEGRAQEWAEFHVCPD